MERADLATRRVAAKGNRDPRLKGRLGFLAVAGLVLMTVPVLAAASSEWRVPQNASGSPYLMAAPRYSPTATLLSGTSARAGKVLVAGGYWETRDSNRNLTGAACTRSAQLFDPNVPNGTSTSPWSTTGSLVTGRAFHTGTDLGDGRVFVAGGFTTNIYGQWVTQKTTEIYNPAAGTFGYTTRYETRIVNRKPTQVAVQVSMNQSRELFTATRLPNGKVLLVGGMAGGTTIHNTAELFDPQAVTIAYTGSMQSTTLIKDPYGVDKWALLGRFEHDAVLIPANPNVPGDQGKVLVVGGKHTYIDYAPSPDERVWTSLQTAELYDIATGKFTSIPMLKSRTRPRVAWIPSVGMALVVGGKYEYKKGTTSLEYDQPQCEWFDPATNSFIEGPFLVTPATPDQNPPPGTLPIRPDQVRAGRMAHTLTDLGDGTWLAAGGWNQSLPNGNDDWTDGATGQVKAGRSVDTAERFVPEPLSPPYYGHFEPMTTMSVSRQDHAAVMLPGYRVLVVGGKPNVRGDDTYLSSVEIYTRP